MNVRPYLAAPFIVVAMALTVTGLFFLFVSNKIYGGGDYGITKGRPNTPSRVSSTGSAGDVVLSDNSNEPGSRMVSDETN